jgi:hypothetical protein
VTHPVCIPTVAIRRLKNRGPRFSAPLAYGEPAIKSTDRELDGVGMPTVASRFLASRLLHHPGEPDEVETRSLARARLAAHLVHHPHKADAAH